MSNRCVMMIQETRRLLPAAACALLMACSLASPVGAAQGAAGADPESRQRLDSVARLLAGLTPSHADHEKLALTSAWKEHSREIQTSWSRVLDRQLMAVTAWRDTELPRGCPAGRTLLYPFSGPDFLNAYWLFPDCAAYVLFGLERVGEVPKAAALKPKDFAQLLLDVRRAMINLFARNYFVTDTMSRQLRTQQLRGVLPVLIVSMALSGVEVLKVEPHQLASAARTTPAPADRPPAGGRWKRELHGVTIEFRRPGSAQVQRLTYFSLDATDAGLAAYPEFLDHLRGLAPTTTLIKSASYLLHGNEFRRVRDVLLEASEFLVQDDTGLPYGLLLKRGWQVRLYGTYGIPIPPFEYAYQPALAAAYEREKPAPLSFRFGYHLNQGDVRSNLMVGRRGAAAAGAR